MGSRRLPSSLMVSCATRRLRVGARAGGRMEDECVGSGGDRCVGQAAAAGRTGLAGSHRAGALRGREEAPGSGGGRGKTLVLVGEVSFSKNSDSPCLALVHWLRGGLGCRSKISSGISPETRHT